MQVTSLRALIEDWDFQEAAFMEFVAPYLQLLANLLQESTEFDTQLQVTDQCLLNGWVALDERLMIRVGLCLVTLCCPQRLSNSAEIVLCFWLTVVW